MGHYYKDKIADLKSEAETLTKKIPPYMKMVPDVKAGFDLQKRAFSLMEEMQTELENFTGGNQ